ncbi:MAG TPA: glycosyltransferase family 4 protein [Ktedonobacteraceae bacterium]
MPITRVCIASETFLPLIGGSEKQAFLQSKCLRERGMETTIITMHFQRECPVYEVLEGVPVLRVARGILIWRDLLPGVLRRFCYLLALSVLGWQLWQRRHTYDILHVFQFSLFTLPALFVCRLAHKPLVVGMRNDSPLSQRGRRAHSWSDLDGLAHLGRPVLRLINHQLWLAQARILVLSTHMRSSLKHYGLDGAITHLLPNGVDIARFTPHPEHEEPLTVVCVARFRHQKGIDVLLCAWSLLVEQLPAARLLLVGDGPLFASLQRLVEELKITDSVEFVGMCANVAQQYQRGSIAVLPSRWEGMPNALLEAMACGRACVATRVSGSADLLFREEHGLLVEPEDRNGLAAALWLLLTDPELVRRYGQAARQHVEQHYTLPRLMDKQQELYEDLLMHYHQKKGLRKIDKKWRENHKKEIA